MIIKNFVQSVFSMIIHGNTFPKMSETHLFRSAYIIRTT